MTDMTCPTCQTDEQTRIKQDARPTLLLTCDQCRTRWTVTVPDCGPGLHDWYDLTKTISGRSPRGQLPRMPGRPAIASPR